MSAARVPAALLLAAGAARRYGRSKQLEAYEGVALVRRAAQSLLAVADEVTVLLGCEAEAVRGALAGLPLAFIECPDWAEGMGRTLASGAAALAARATVPSAVLVALADQPRIDAAALQRLVDTWAIKPAQIAASRYAERLGPPVIFPADSLPALAALSGDQGARALLREPGRVLSVVELPEAADDIDTPDDLARLAARPR